MGTIRRGGPDELECSFCGQSQAAVRKIVAGPGVYICSDCVALCNEIIGDELGKEMPVPAAGLARVELELLAAEEARAVAIPASTSGPACRGCGHSIEGATGGRVIEASHHNRPGSLRVLVMYCQSCGTPFHSAVLSEEG